MIYLETPTNPQLEIIDLEWAGAFAKKHKVILNVDNCFATPLLQKPIEYGADLVVHSATKWIDGQGRVLGGVIVGRADLIRDIYLDLSGRFRIRLLPGVLQTPALHPFRRSSLRSTGSSPAHSEKIACDQD